MGPQHLIRLPCQERKTWGNADILYSKDEIQPCDGDTNFLKTLIMIISSSRSDGVQFEENKKLENGFSTSSEVAGAAFRDFTLQIPCKFLVDLSTISKESAASLDTEA